MSEDELKREFTELTKKQDELDKEIKVKSKELTELEGKIVKVFERRKEIIAELEKCRKS